MILIRILRYGEIENTFLNLEINDLLKKAK